MQTLSVYLNQRASNGNTPYWINQVDRALFRSQRFYREPRDFDHLKELLDSDIQDHKVDAMISVGGDGTVNTLIQSLAGTPIGLLVIPAGTANDLARELGNTLSAKKMMTCLRNDEYKFIDLINVNGRYMATNGGLGIGGEVARKINQIRSKYPVFKSLMKLTGKRVYTLFIAKEILALDYQLQRYALECDEFQGEVETAALLINNQPIVAGSLNVAPQTCNSDGAFNVTIIKHKTKQKLMRCMLMLATGHYPANDPDFISFETKNLRIKSLGSAKLGNTFFGDGEIFFQDQKELEITIAPRALKVYTPCKEKSLISLCNEVSIA